MRVAILGAGGVGGWYGGLLARGGHDVRLLARGPHLATIRARGLELRFPGGTWMAHPSATDDPRDLGDPEVVLVAVKSYSLEGLTPLILDLALGGATIVPFLNGVEAAEGLEAAGVPADRLLPGLTYISAHRPEPGVVVRRSDFQRVRVGAPSPVGDALCRALRAVGVEAEATPRIQEELWRKFVFLAAFSAVCGLTRTEIGAVRRARWGKDLLRRAVEEIAAVGRGRGIPLPPDVEGTALGLLWELPDPLKPSFLHDVEAGGPNELDILSGAVARMGREAGVPTPIHDTATVVLGLASGA